MFLTRNGRLLPSFETCITSLLLCWWGVRTEGGTHSALAQRQRRAPASLSSQILEVLQVLPPRPSKLGANGPLLRRTLTMGPPSIIITPLEPNECPSRPGYMFTAKPTAADS